MIKWIFGILVLVNITLWMWGTWYRAESGDQIKVDINGDSMRLLSAPDVQKGGVLMPWAPTAATHRSLPSISILS